ncbi:tail fiber domain-containing protein [Candidatus Peregrinibacteria bacterium]|nr:tail fiber domain-containing protein [Candidatus Peregrinibacteria bacterium]
MNVIVQNAAKICYNLFRAFDGVNGCTSVCRVGAPTGAQTTACNNLYKATSCNGSCGSCQAGYIPGSDGSTCIPSYKGVAFPLTLETSTNKVALPTGCPAGSVLTFKLGTYGGVSTHLWQCAALAPAASSPDGTGLIVNASGSLSVQACANGQILKYNTTSPAGWACADAAAGGSGSGSGQWTAATDAYEGYRPPIPMIYYKNSDYPARTRVGIGTAAPTGELEISNGFIGIQVNPGMRWTFVAADGQGSQAWDDNWVNFDIPQGLKNVNFSDNLIVTSGAKVGIGKDVPVAPLDVVGDINATGNIIATGIAAIGRSNTLNGTTLGVEGTIYAGNGNSMMGAYVIPPNGSNGYRIGLGQNLYFNGWTWSLSGDSKNNGGSAILTNYGDGIMRFYTVNSTSGANKTIGNDSLPTYERMTIASNGTTIKNGLTVNGNATISGHVGIGGSTSSSAYGLEVAGGLGVNGKLIVYPSAGDNQNIILGQTYFGHGVTIGGDLRAPLWIDTASAPYSILHFRWYATGEDSGWSTGGIPVNQASIYAQGRVIASEFNAFSDARIKNIQDERNPNNDLEALKKLHFIDYKYIDEIKNGSGVKSGLIAQEVEKILPQAVRQTSDFMPDIFQLAKSVKFDGKAKTLTIQIEKAHGLKVGDLVRLVTPEGNSDFIVSKVLSDTAFVVDGATRSFDQVFVYGKQVKDYRVLDYDQVFTLGLSAMQALDKKVEELTKENADLEARLEKIEAKLK